MTTMRTPRPLLPCLLLSLLLACAATPLWAQQPGPPSLPPPSGSQAAWPAWEQLTAEQREVLLTQLRERWNADPGQRQKMMEHARRWRDMTPQQREQARQGMRRYEDMSPQQREQARALFEHMRGLPPAQRRALHDTWKNMTAQQRQDWVRAHPPQRDDDPD